MFHCLLVSIQNTSRNTSIIQNFAISIFEYTKTSAKSNFQELNSSGMLEVKNGIPVSVRKRIEELFNQAMMGNVRPKDLHKELNDWNLFEE